MYDFHYHFIKRNVDAELLFIDTDSLTYEIKSEDVYEEFFNHKHLFDFSNYQKDLSFFDQTNKKVIGKMKDVSEGKIIDEFVGLKSKMYSMANIDGKESNKAKGVNVTTEFKNSKTLYLTKKESNTKEKNSKSCEINKISSSCFDDKRFALDDGIHTFAYFY